MDEAKLAVGTLVRLKSGGPLMTVARNVEPDDGEYRVEWFDLHGELQEGWFEPAMLVIE